MRDSARKGSRCANKLRWHMLVALTVGATPWINAHAADTCESTFQSSGTVASGLTFDAQTTVAGLSAREAIEQMKGIGTSEGFTVVPGQASGQSASLVLEQKPGMFSRGFRFDVGATDAGPVLIHVDMPSGMLAREKDLRKAMCGMLAQIKPGTDPGHVEAPTPVVASAVHGPTAPETVAAHAPPPHIAARPSAAPPAPAQASTPPLNAGPVETAAEASVVASTKPLDVSIPAPSPVPPAASTQMCLVNWSDSAPKNESARDWVDATWTLAPGGGDAPAAIERVKQGIAGNPALKAHPESYHGKVGTLIVDVVAPGPYLIGNLDNRPVDLRPFPMEITYDASLDAVSVVMRPNQEQQLRPAQTRQLACSVAAMATQSPAPKPPKGSSSFIEWVAHDGLPDVNTQRHVSKDLLLQRAVRAGKAFVITPVLDVDWKYQKLTDNDRLSDALVKYWLDLTAAIRWQRRDAPDAMPLMTGFRTGANMTGLGGYMVSFGGSAVVYPIYIVDPGTYDMVGAQTQLRRVTLPPVAGSRWNATPAVGSLSLSAKLDADFDRTNEWHDAVYDNVTYDTSYCAFVHVGTGQCMSGVTQTTTRREKIFEAGFREHLTRKTSGGLMLNTTLAKPFASFTVGAGEVAFVDGFGVDGDSAPIDTQACKSSSETVATCALTQFSAWRYPVEMLTLIGARKRPMFPSKVLLNILNAATRHAVTMDPKAAMIPAETDPNTRQVRFAVKQP